MAYDPDVAERVRRALKRHKGITERKMFGGLAFLLQGNMCCGIVGKELMLRLGEEWASRALTNPYVRAMDFTGRPMKSMVYITPEGFFSDNDLRGWLDQAVTFAKGLPAK